MILFKCILYKAMPLTATYTNQNNILDSHNNNTNKNTYYVQKQCK